MSDASTPVGPPHDLEVGPATVDERGAVIDLFASGQVEPTRHIAYLSLGTEPIAAELTALEPGGWDDVVVARRDGLVIGALAAEHDREPPRVWWHGPAVVDRDDVDFLDVAGALLEAGRARLPAHVTEEELAGDDRHVELTALASRYGFDTAPASAVLSRACTPPPVAPEVAAIRPFTESDRPVVAAIHDATFPNNHQPGHRVDEGTDRTVLVAERDGHVAGYAAVERHEDGSGYLDLVGVDPASRGAGVGAALVVAALVHLGALGCEVANLTVRETNAVARRLYERLGFTEERLVRPHRRGFHLP
ncbi:GNAT family N-acetyltransferase [Nitriliruptor alkaliphilus]|uniref:GNAT family N-acetyltransferase n=1 Tax=Nitriliruptor alkaliphilus TaxID=427918 RepID=UPI000695E32E|nr:GNAT family N-acetyltransferase [Nitriliruptor alkaliphilus]